MRVQTHSSTSRVAFEHTLDRRLFESLETLSTTDSHKAWKGGCKGLSRAGRGWGSPSLPKRPRSASASSSSNKLPGVASRGREKKRRGRVFRECDNAWSRPRLGKTSGFPHHRARAVRYFRETTGCTSCRRASPTSSAPRSTSSFRRLWNNLVEDLKLVLVRVGETGVPGGLWVRFERVLESHGPVLHRWNSPRSFRILDWKRDQRDTLLKKANIEDTVGRSTRSPTSSARAEPSRGRSEWARSLSVHGKNLVSLSLCDLG